MANQIVRLSIPFNSLVESIAELSFEDKQRLWEFLDEEIAQAEEKLEDQDPTTQAEIQQARADYEAGNFVTIEEYIAAQDNDDQ